LSRLVIPRIECTESENNFGRFIAEPLEKGVGKGGWYHPG